MWGKNKLRWYPHQLQYFIFIFFWRLLRSQALETLLNLLEPDLALHQRFPKPSPGPSLQPSPAPVEPDLAVYQGLLRALVEPDLALHQSLPDLLHNLLRIPVKPDPALHQSVPSPEPSPEPSLALHHQSLPHLLWNLLRNPVERDLALHQSLPEPSPQRFPKPCLTWPGSAPKPPKPSPEPFLEPSPEPCWTWAGSPPNPPWPSLEPFLEPSPEPCWTWLGFAPRLPGTFSGTFSGTLLNLTYLCTKASQTFSGTFGTFSGTSLNLTRRLHQCTPELFWAEDPISLRCWGKTPDAWTRKDFYPFSLMWRAQGCESLTVPDSLTCNAHVPPIVLPTMILTLPTIYHGCPSPNVFKNMVSWWMCK